MPASFKSHYGSPVVMGLTPYTLTKIAPPGASVDWPPFVDSERLKRYAEYEALIENEANEVFERLGLAPGQQETISIALALPELIVNVWADALYGENSPDVTFEDDTVRDQFDAIWSGNGDDDVLGWEAIFAAGMSGTGVLRLFRDDDEVVKVEEIDPATYFPILKVGSSREIEAVDLAWIEDRGSDEKAELWEVKERYDLEAGHLRITRQERRQGATEFRAVKEENVQDVPFLPFVDTHAKRWRGRYWGISELARNMSVFDEIDATLSNIARILEYHGAPVLQVPRGWMFGGVLSKGTDRVYGVNRAEDKDIARYITYDGQIDASIKHLDGLISKALLVSEINEVYFGKTEGSADSGVALRLRLQNYLKKVGRWQKKDEARLIALADKALFLDGVTDAAARVPTITFGSPLPIDELQESQITSGLIAAGLMSQRVAIRRLRTVDDIDEEIDAIKADKEAATVGAPVPLRALPTPEAPRPAGLGAIGVPIETPSAAGGSEQRALT